MNENTSGISTSVENIVPSPYNPRKRFNETELAELANSIKQHGLIQPILVRPIDDAQYEIVAGERRWRATKLAGLETIPAIIRELDDKTAMELQILENLQRSDLHPLEEAQGFKSLLNKTGGWTPEQLAQRIGKSRSYIYGSLKLTELCTYAQDKFYEGSIQRETALLIARIPAAKMQEEATKSIIKMELSYRSAVEYLKNRFTLDLTKAQWDKHSNKMPGTETECVSCLSCPKRTGNYPELYPDIESPDVCTDIECYDTKKRAYAQHVINTQPNVIHGEEAEKIAPHGVNSYVTNGYASNLNHVMLLFNDRVFTADELFDEDSKPKGVTIVDKNGDMKTVFKAEDVKTLMQQKIQEKVDKLELALEPTKEEDNTPSTRRLERDRREAMFFNTLDRITAQHFELVLLATVKDFIRVNDTELLHKHFNHEGSDDEFIEKHLSGNCTLKNLVKMLTIFTFAAAITPAWDWASSKDNEEDEDYQRFIDFINHAQLPLAEIQTARLPLPPNSAAQAKEQAPEEASPETPKPETQTLAPSEGSEAPTPEHAAIKERALAKKAKRDQAKAQKESANADI